MLLRHGGPEPPVTLRPPAGRCPRTGCQCRRRSGGGTTRPHRPAPAAAAAAAAPPAPAGVKSQFRVQASVQCRLQAWEQSEAQICLEPFPHHIMDSGTARQQQARMGLQGRGSIAVCFTAPGRRQAALQRWAPATAARGARRHAVPVSQPAGICRDGEAAGSQTDFVPPALL